MGKPPHPWLLVHNQVRKSRQRSGKPRRQYGLSGATTQLSLRYLFCQNCVPLRDINRSLSQSFNSAFLTSRNTVRWAFTFALYSRFPTWMSSSLGPLDTFSRGCRPSQTARLPVSSFELAFRWQISSVTLSIHCSKKQFSSLLLTLCTHQQNTMTSCSKGLQGLGFPIGVSGLCTRMGISEDFSQGQWQSR